MSVGLGIRRLPSRDPGLNAARLRHRGRRGHGPPGQSRAGGSRPRPDARAGARALVGTGLALEIPPGHEVQVRPRSGLAFRLGLTVLNAPGTIDSDYRGEVSVILINHGREDVTIAHGDRIAQMVLSPVSRIEWRETEELGASARGTGGFGSTGTGS